MKNNEFTIYISSKRGRAQIFRKGSKGWALISGRGNIYTATAEQVLNHVLPALAGKKAVNIIVSADK
jgi:hypothetical protein